jgi:hypothetical protein
LNQHPSRSRLDQSIDRAQKSRLSRPTPAEQGSRSAGRYVEADAVENCPAPGRGEADLIENYLADAAPSAAKAALLEWMIGGLNIAAARQPRPFKSVTHGLKPNVF